MGQDNGITESAPGVKFMSPDITSRGGALSRLNNPSSLGSIMNIKECK